MKKKMSTFILLLVFFIGLSVLLYPALSDYWNSKTQTQAIIDYDAMLKELGEGDYTELFSKADGYNAELYELAFPLVEYGRLKDYWSILDLNGNGMMGYVTIPKIGVELPIYHGTSEAVLNVAAGHVEGTSMPAGGVNTHTVLSAHRGLPSAKLFTDLDKVEVGDVFTLRILDRTLTYQVDQIRIVGPDDTSELSIEGGADRCTLLTCTPYGINTHRMLVRGSRIETVERRVIRVTNDAYRIDTLIVTPVVALPMLFVLMMIVLFKPVKKKIGDDES